MNPTDIRDKHFVAHSRTNKPYGNAATSETFSFSHYWKNCREDWKLHTSLGRPVELSRFYRQTRDLITCNARPQTPQRHWLALQCNETSYPEKWPPHVSSEATIRQDLFKERTAEKDWKTGLDFQQALLLGYVPARYIWCVYDSDVLGMLLVVEKKAHQGTNVWALFVCFCQPFWNDDALFHFLISHSPSCAVVCYWGPRAMTKHWYLRNFGEVWFQTFNETAIPQSCCTIIFMTH